MSLTSKASRKAARSPFGPGRVVVISLGSPREKFWGVLLSLDAAGISAAAITLDQVDEFARLVRDGTQTTAPVVFFPMQRIERIDLDLAVGELPSLAARFAAATQRSVSSIAPNLAKNAPRGRGGR